MQTRARVGCWFGCISFVAAIAFFIWLVGFSNVCAGMFGIETYKIAGDVRHFDPYKELPQIRAKVGAGAILKEIDAEYVRSDGTMDLEATYKPPPTVEYTFVMPLAKPPADAPPVGASRGPDDKWYQEVRVSCGHIGQRYTVRRMSGGSSTQFSYTNEGIEIDRHSATSGTIPTDLGDPKVSCAQIWDMALKAGAPKDAVAIIRLTSSGYDFGITRSTNLRLDLDGKPR